MPPTSPTLDLGSGGPKINSSRSSTSDGPLLFPQNPLLLLAVYSTLPTFFFSRVHRRSSSLRLGAGSPVALPRRRGRPRQWHPPWKGLSRRRRPPRRATGAAAMAPWPYPPARLATQRHLASALPVNGKKMRGNDMSAPHVILCKDGFEA